MLASAISDIPPGLAQTSCPVVASAPSNFRGGWSGLVVNLSDRTVTLRVMNVIEMERPTDPRLDRDTTTPVAIEPANLGPHAGRYFRIPYNLTANLMGLHDSVSVTFDC